MSGIRIRSVTEADLPAVSDIYNHYVRTSTVTFDEVETTAEDWARSAMDIAAAGIPFLVAEDDAGSVLGYALGRPWSRKSAFRYTIENSIYLAEGAAGRGVGRTLLRAFLDASRKAGVRHVIAVIAGEGAEASIALHRRAGFLEKGELDRVGSKFGREIGVLFLQKQL